jgi:hypothetical protein
VKEKCVIHTNLHFGRRVASGSDYSRHLLANGTRFDIGLESAIDCRNQRCGDFGFPKVNKRIYHRHFMGHWPDVSFGVIKNTRYSYYCYAISYNHRFRRIIYGAWNKITLEQQPFSILL